MQTKKGPQNLPSIIHMHNVNEKGIKELSLAW